ncbi:hypothetical protein BKA63DRAFT_527673 [Paraphoma chrysanthemicola]|nr:hypothetical protein BKA63DRAFT_528458 [Paraphoma chrysanthemicola]KAH7061841.1 hypothetical protein BKA63DRAFT_527673 [Paraphoma chrysanthemicola]
MVTYVKQLSRPDQSTLIPHAVLGEPSHNDPQTDAGTYESLMDWSVRESTAQSQWRSLRAEEDESHKVRENSEQTDRTCTAHSSGESTYHPEQAEDAASSPPPDRGGDTAELPVGSKRRALKDITGEMQDHAGKRVMTKGRIGLSTRHSYFTPLSHLCYHLNSKCPIDVLAVVSHVAGDHQNTASRPRSPSPTFYISDWSLEHSTPVEIQPPFRGSLPSVHDGDGILLRNFVVRSAHHQLYLLSCDVSAWCIFTDSDSECSSGPPVEFGDVERTEIASMRRWWGT